MRGYRFEIIRVLIFGVLLLLFSRLFTLTVFSGEYYRNLSSGNRVREEVIPANRGVIYDRRKELLAVNAPAFLDGDQVITKEEALLTKDAKVVASRDYLLREAAAHVLGYINLVDHKGVAGLELEYDRRLRGVDGRELVETDAAGRRWRSLGVIKPVDGENLVTTLDGKLQQKAYELIAGKKGAVVVSNPETGEVLALVSSPSFDPDLFTFPQTPDRQEKVKLILDDTNQPFFNRAIGAVYPPGSTFKIISAAAGLESGKITAETMFEDRGVLVIGPYKFYNWLFVKRGGFDGWINLVNALKRSNDIYFYNLGERVGVDALTEMAKTFGLGQKSGIDLPEEAAGLVPDQRWRSNYARAWYLGDTYHLAIGQGDLLVTPLQVNSWTAVIANGGNLCRPYLVGQPNCRSLKLKPETLKLISQGLSLACKPGGTAYPLFDLEVDVHCKTGTAEFGDPKNRTHAWLTAFVPKEEAAKFNKDPIAVTVLLEAAGEGSDAAAPVVKELIKEWLKGP
jgi:penicillin-binding protein 2